MESERPGVTRDEARDEERSPIPRLGWAASFTLGFITLVLGVIIAFRPAQTLTAIAVLVGVVMIVSGVYHIARAFDGRENERVWRGISGVLFVLAGLVLLRHLHLSVALIGLFIGFTWIIQGIATLMEGFSRGRGHAETGWSVFFGVISLIAGIVLVAAPIASVGALTIFLGIWFIVMGAFEMIGSVIARRTETRQAAEGVHVPGQRSGAARQEAADSPASRNVRG